MIEALKPYTEYKESGQTWIGAVPSHWAVLPNRAIFSEAKEREHPNEEMLSVTITRGVIRQKTLLTGSSKKDGSNEDKSAYKLVCPRDLAYNKMRAWQGAIGISDLRGIISPAYVVMRLRGWNVPRYFHHLYRTPSFAKEAERWSYGITSDMWSLRPEHFKMIYTPLPQPDEQAAIVRFLDYANGRLERAIRVKRKLIALLNEQKQAVIHRAVTRGLDLNVELKPSGIAWLGSIPRTWQVLPLKSLCLIQSGITLGKNYFGQRLSEYAYLRVANVQAGRLNLDVVKTVAVPADEAQRSNLKIGDVLMTEGGDPDKLGRGCVWEGQIDPCLHQNHIFAVRPHRDQLLPQYLSAILSSQYAKDYFLVTAKQTTNLASTNKTTIGRFRVPLPTPEEQLQILTRLGVATAPMSRAIARAENEIDLLREYRMRLVADVVTGKLDVRNADVPLDEISANPGSLVDAAEVEADEDDLIEENADADN